MNERKSPNRRAALHAQREAEAKRKRVTRIMIAAFSVIALAIVSIVTLVVIRQIAPQRGEQLTPPNATKEYGIMPYKSAKLAEGAPKVVVWEDPQCPICGVTSKHFGPALHELAKKGEISLEYRVVSFLDAGLNNDASLRAARGQLIADKFGKFSEYADAVYEAQPEHEGDGFTDSQLRDQIPAKIGLTGADLAEFQKLYDQKATDAFVEQATELGHKENIGGTPAIFTNGNSAPLLLQDQSTGTTYPASENTAEAVLKYFKEKG